MISEEQQEQASLYILGLLPPHEAGPFETAMESNAELRELVRDLRETVAPVALSAEVRTPPATLKDRVLQQVGAESSIARNRLSWLPWGIAACLAAASILLLMGRAQLANTVKALQERIVSLTAERNSAIAVASKARERAEAVQSQMTRFAAERDALNRKIAQLEEQTEVSRVEAAKLTASRDALQERVNALERNADVLVATMTSKRRDSPKAVATIVWDGAKQQGVLRAEGVPATTSEQDYQLWIADPEYKDPVDGGIFSVGESGSTEIVFRPKLHVTAAKAFLVSLERKGGVSKAQGPIVLASK